MLERMGEIHQQESHQDSKVKRPLSECVDRVKQITGDIFEDAGVTTRCKDNKKGSAQERELTKMKQHIETLTESQRKLEQDQKTSAAKIEALTVTVGNTPKAVETQIAKYHAAIQAKIHRLEKDSKATMKNMETAQGNAFTAVKKEISNAQVSQKTDMSKLKNEIKDVRSCMLESASQNHKEVCQLLNNVLTNQQSQQLQNSSQLFKSTSTLSSGFCDATILEEEEDSEQEILDTAHDDKVAISDRTIPSGIKEVGLKLETLIHGRVKHLARHLDIDHRCVTDMIDDQDHKKDYRNLFWDVIATWCDQCRRKRMKITRKEFLAAVQKCGVAGDVEPMSPLDQEIIEKNVPMMMRNLIVPSLVVELRGSGLLCPDIVNYIQETSQQIEKVTRLVDVLSILGDRALDTLIKALRQSEQGHIADKIIASYPNRFHQLKTSETTPKKTGAWGGATQSHSLSRPTRCTQPIKESQV